MRTTSFFTGLIIICFSVLANAQEAKIIKVEKSNELIYSTLSLTGFAPGKYSIQLVSDGVTTWISQMDIRQGKTEVIKFPVNNELGSKFWQVRVVKSF